MENIDYAMERRLAFEKGVDIGFEIIEAVAKVSVGIFCASAAGITAKVALSGFHPVIQVLGVVGAIATSTVVSMKIDEALCDYNDEVRNAVKYLYSRWVENRANNSDVTFTEFCENVVNQES